MSSRELRSLTSTPIRTRSQTSDASRSAVGSAVAPRKSQTSATVSQRAPIVPEVVPTSAAAVPIVPVNPSSQIGTSDPREAPGVDSTASQMFKKERINEADRNRISLDINLETLG